MAKNDKNSARDHSAYDVTKQQIAAVYAKAFFGVAEEAGKIDALAADRLQILIAGVFGLKIQLGIIFSLIAVIGWAEQAFWLSDIRCKEFGDRFFAVEFE